MLNSFKNEDFERFLKGSADGLRMRPSDGVWKKINQRMNHRRRGVIISSTIFLLTASLFGYYLVDSAKSIDDPMSTTNIIQEPHSTPYYKTEKAPKATHRTATATAPVTRAAQTNEGVTQLSVLNKGLVPALVAAWPLYQPLHPQGLLTRFEEGEYSFEPTVVDEYVPATDKVTAKPEKEKETLLASAYPQTIESVTNLYRRQFRSPKTEWQFIFTPTVSYRRLSENKSFLRQVPAGNTTFLNAMNTNVNNVVSHKPAIGLELGMAFKYRVSNSIKLRSGLQLNVSRYDIKAYSAFQPELATIALNNATGIDSINTLTRFRNLNNAVMVGDWLENSYVQVSMPLGAEVKVLGNRNSHIGIATSVQPTYVLSDRAYLISADYKSYSKVPSLTRRWNVHTAVEAYIGYSTGKLAWQIGPQVRYQLLSSFDSEYPVKENLFDFGLKVGVSLNKQ